MAADYDSPWKEALDFYFERSMALLYPEIHPFIDWQRVWESLDKELQQIARDAEIGRRYVDKLFKVWTKSGVECWVLIHIEIQADRDAEFPLRMFVYHYRIFDKYNKPVVSLAILADDDPDWRPSEFRQEEFGCEVRLRFPTVKLLDFAAREAELEASDNPFAMIVLAHLKAKQTHGDPRARQLWKLRLIRGLYERGFSAKDVRELFRLIDWLMVLPPPLEIEFRQEVKELQKEKHMPYITSIERVDINEALRKGIRTALKLRFGAEGLALMPAIEVVYDRQQLEAILVALETVTSLDEVRPLCTPTPFEPIE